MPTQRNPNMARIDPTGPLGQFRGRWTLGVTSSNASAWYIRAYRTGSKYASTPQLNQRNRFTTAANAWQKLTPAQKAAWNSAADLPAWQLPDWFGNPKNPTGRGLFIRLNIPLIRAGLTIITSPPDPVFPAQRTITSASLTRSGSTTTGTLTFSPATTTTERVACVYVKPGGIASPQPSTWGLFFDGQTTTAGATSISLWQAAGARFGPLIPDQTVTVALVIFDTSGRPSPRTITTVNVTEP